MAALGGPGEDVKDGGGVTVEISEDGYWVINGEKTDVKAQGGDGEKGSILLQE